MLITLDGITERTQISQRVLSHVRLLRKAKDGFKEEKKSEAALESERFSHATPWEPFLATQDVIHHQIMKC